MNKIFLTPFAANGNRQDVPDAANGDGYVSFYTGYTPDYERQTTLDPSAKDVERQKMNQILYLITSAIQYLQTIGVPDFIAPAMNGGKAYAYPRGATVRDASGSIFRSLVDGNLDTPPSAKWQSLDSVGVAVDPFGGVTGDGSKAAPLALLLAPQGGLASDKTGVYLAPVVVPAPVASTGAELPTAIIGDRSALLGKPVGWFTINGKKVPYWT